MPSDLSEPIKRPSRDWLRRAEQGFLAAMLFLACAALTAYWVQRGLIQRRLIEFDHAPRRTILFQVNINTAGWSEIALLPDVGETTARRIVKERETGGPYRSLDDLGRRVKGIGPKMLAGIEPYLLPIAESSLAADDGEAGLDPADID